jgi:hypothetical protein
MKKGLSKTQKSMHFLRCSQDFIAFLFEQKEIRRNQKKNRYPKWCLVSVKKISVLSDVLWLKKGGDKGKFSNEPFFRHPGNGTVWTARRQNFFV